MSSSEGLRDRVASDTPMAPTASAREPAPRRRAVSRLASRVPYRVLTLGYERVLMPVVTARMRRNGTSFPAPVVVADQWASMPLELREAVSGRGGPESIDQSLTRFTRRWNAVPLAILTKGPGWWDRVVTVTGRDALGAAQRAGSGAIVVMPHVGPRSFVFVHLVHLGFPVALLTNIEPASAHAYTGLVSRLTPFADIGSKMTLIPLPSLLSVRRADAALARGSALIWAPDKVHYYTPNTRVVECDWLGRRIGLSPVVYSLARRRGAPVFLVSTRLGEGTAPTIAVDYERLDPEKSEDASAYTRRLAHHAELAVRANIDQAELWWHYPDDV
jgi:lauroyl/myristoyl acyltransferase